MPPRLPCVVIAALPRTISTVKPFLGDEFRLIEAPTYDEAVRAIKNEAPDVIIVGYFFDALRPYRLIHHIRDDLAAMNTPILMVQAFPVERGQLEKAEVRQTYQRLGVREFVDLPEMLQRLGERKASRELREILRRFVL